MGEILIVLVDAWYPSKYYPSILQLAMYINSTSPVLFLNFSICINSTPADVILFFWYSATLDLTVGDI